VKILHISIPTADGVSGLQHQFQTVDVTGIKKLDKNRQRKLNKEGEGKGGGKPLLIDVGKLGFISPWGPQEPKISDAGQKLKGKTLGNRWGVRCGKDGGEEKSNIGTTKSGVVGNKGKVP